MVDGDITGLHCLLLQYSTIYIAA